MRPDLISLSARWKPHGANEFVFVVATGIRMMDFPSGSWLNTPTSQLHTVQFPPGHPLIGRSDSPCGHWLLLPRFRFQTLSLAACDSSPGGKKGCIAQDSELRISPGARCSSLSLAPRASSPDCPEHQIHLTGESKIYDHGPASPEVTMCSTQTVCDSFMGARKRRRSR